VEIVKVLISNVESIFIGVSEDCCFATKSEIILARYCEQNGWGIPLDSGIRNFSVVGFFQYVETHPLLSKVKNWDEIGLTKPKLYT